MLLGHRLSLNSNVSFLNELLAVKFIFPFKIEFSKKNILLNFENLP